MKFWDAIKNYFGNLGPVAVDHEAEYLAEKEASDKPWASFEVGGFEDDGRIKIKFNWNQTFIEKIKGLGFEAETDEDTVQLFFYTSSMRPTHLAGDPQDDAVQSSTHPQLSQIQNELRVG
jgi:hypothetical protein